jgi:hypothetical protein
MVAMNKRDAKTYKPREQQYDMFRDQSLIVGVICLCGDNHAQNRNISFAANGMNAILSELKYQYEYVTIDHIKDYYVCLLSLTSISDVEQAALQIQPKDKGDCTVIAGGQGCLSIHPIMHIIDVAVFGRAEGQINDIIDGAMPPNVWRKENDPYFLGRYQLRQATTLLTDVHEQSIGCKYKCHFCQYTWTRKLWGDRYTHNSDLYAQEDSWNDLVARPGRNCTAWDGWSERTRLAVNKRITDAQIHDKLSAIMASGFTSVVNLKIFNIVWYPWETEASLTADIANVSKLLSSCDAEHGTRILIMFLVTPFSPEPLTPMADCSANVTADTRGIFERIGRQVFQGRKIEAFVLPQINSGFTLAKRVLINRGISGAYLAQIIKACAKYPASEKVKVMSDQLDMSVFGWLRMEGNLDSYCKIPESRAHIVCAECG